MICTHLTNSFGSLRQTQWALNVSSTPQHHLVSQAGGKLATPVLLQVNITSVLMTPV
jgi:hypothetical protein